ncbi:hypothetical protein DENIS_2288 [Desulfonema ishimotonii]|uniref:DSBA-like thioredoxin domain-containing protein n=1 Tax=Desulfonema ishimotonii TaxID=45657 RepID=A0A401FWI3_9BACT|nr:hypothetical protein DENIS_2288 [Desulfonema ishimotonii]
MPEEGISLEKLSAKYVMDAGQMRRYLEKTAAESDVPFQTPERIFNSRLAHELGFWAEVQGRGDAFHMAAFRAYFVDGLNIARMPVLAELAESAGLSGETAIQVLERGDFAPVVDADWAFVSEKGVKVAPTFMINDQKLPNAQPYEMLERFIVKNGACKRT